MASALTGSRITPLKNILLFPLANTHDHVYMCRHPKFNFPKPIYWVVDDKRLFCFQKVLLKNSHMCSKIVPIFLNVSQNRVVHGEKDDPLSHGQYLL